MSQEMLVEKARMKAAATRLFSDIGDYLADNHCALMTFIEEADHSPGAEELPRDLKIMMLAATVIEKLYMDVMDNTIERTFEARRTMGTH